MRFAALIAILTLALVGCSDDGTAFWTNDTSGGAGAGTGATGGSGGGGGGGSGTGGGGGGGGGTSGPPATCSGACSEAVLVHALAAGERLVEYTISEDGTVVAYMSDDDPLGTNAARTNQIYTKVIGPMLPVQITPDTGETVSPGAAFSFNQAGTDILFGSVQDLTGNNAGKNRNIFISAVDGTAVTQVTAITTGGLTGNTGSPRIANDNTTIIFGSAEDLTGANPFTNPQIFSINADGSNLVQLTPMTAIVERLTIARNGSRIVWQDQSDPFGTNADNSREIFIMNIDGSNLMQLTAGTGNSEGPQISDDGTRIVFASTSEFTAGSNPDGLSEVYVINSDGTGLTQITNTDQESGTYFTGALGAVDISGNGQWIAFNSRADLYGINTDNTFTIYWASFDGTTVQQLLRDETKPTGVASRFADYPVLNADGSVILFGALAPYATGAPSAGPKLFTHVRE